MSCLVMKFGGAAFKNSADFSKVAQLIKSKYEQSRSLVVVVSAMANMTDQLIKLANNIHPSPPQRELDMLVSIGERVSISLLCMALNQIGIRAISFTGSQSGIITTCDHSQAKILDVRPSRLQKHLLLGDVVVVAGFQGVSVEKEITTLGRGGSDTSAVALAVALEADRVEFYKDVGFLYDADPKKNTLAKKIVKISLSQALLQAQQAGSLLHPRCLQLALLNHLPLTIHSLDLNTEPGSFLYAECERSISEKKYEG